MIYTYIYIMIRKKMIKSKRTRKMKKKHLGGTEKQSNDNKKREKIKKSRKLHPYSIFPPGHTPDKIIRHEGTLVNYKTKQQDFDNKRFVGKGDKVTCFLKFEDYLDYLYMPYLKDHLAELVSQKKMVIKDKMFKKACLDVQKCTLEERNNFCHNEIGRQFLIESVTNCDALLLLRRDEIILGFASIKFTEFNRNRQGDTISERSIEVDLICSSDLIFGGGRMLMEFIIKELGNPVFKYKFITLKAIQIKNTIDFYLRNGFKFDDGYNCPQDYDDYEANQLDGLCKMKRML